MEDNQNQSYYFPGCRKDASCSCDICLDSINTTLDLIPSSVHKSSLTRTRLSITKPELQRPLDKTPILIDPSLFSTPISRTPDPIPLPKSTAKTVCPKNGGAKKKKIGFWVWFLRRILLFGLILGLEFGFSMGFLRVLRPRLSEQIVREIAANSLAEKSLSDRLMLIQEGLMGYVDSQVTSCNVGDSSWKINQDDLILNSHCILFRWAAEEVIVWGWPLQTSGLLTAGFSSRSFTVLSGRITEWPKGSIVSVVRETNSTWLKGKWSASVVQFDPNTWIIEYKKSMFLENPSIFFPMIEFFKSRISRFTRKMKKQLWLFADQRNHCTASLSEAGLKIPT